MAHAITRFKGASSFESSAGTDPFPFIPLVDPIESLGSLMLVEPAHPAQPWAGGAPASGVSTVRNLLRDFARLTVGSGVAADYDATLDVFGLSGTKGLVERTTKGGVHAILSLTATDSSGYNFLVCDPVAIFNYIKANPTHHFYHSIMGRVTRPATPVSSYTVNGQLVGFNYDTIAHNQTVNAPDGARPSVNVVGPAFRNAGSFLQSTMPASYTTAANAIFQVGNKNVVSGNFGRSGSHVFYRAYVEDLTVSGRSYAAVDAIDSAIFTKEVLTAGGRYYGDTFTDPATIA